MARKPETASLREVNVQARRQRILQAARELLAQGGVAALSMRKLGEHAELSVNTLYNLVGSRDRILTALIEDAIERLAQVFRDQPPTDDPIERCHALVATSVRHVVEAPAVFRAMAVARHERMSSNGAEDRRTTERAVTVLTEAIDNAVAHGSLMATLDSRRLGEKVHEGWTAALEQWAFGLIDDAVFATRALHGLHLVLLAVATDSVRPRLQQTLQQLEEQLVVPSKSRRGRRATKR